VGEATRSGDCDSHSGPSGLRSSLVAITGSSGIFTFCGKPTRGRSGCGCSDRLFIVRGPKSTSSLSTRAVIPCLQTFTLTRTAVPCVQTFTLTLTAVPYVQTFIANV